MQKNKIIDLQFGQSKTVTCKPTSGKSNIFSGAYKSQSYSFMLGVNLIFINYHI